MSEPVATINGYVYDRPAIQCLQTLLHDGLGYENPLFLLEVSGHLPDLQRRLERHVRAFQTCSSAAEMVYGCYCSKLGRVCLEMKHFNAALLNASEIPEENDS